MMLNLLQQRSAEGHADWAGVEPALDRFAELLAPEDDRPIVSAAGETWWVEIGPVDPGQVIAIFQRRDELIAALMVACA